MNTDDTSARHSLTILWSLPNIWKFWMNEYEKKTGIPSPYFEPYALQGKCFRFVLFKSYGIPEFLEKYVNLSFEQLNNAFDFPIDFQVSITHSNALLAANCTVRNQVVEGKGFNVVFSWFTNETALSIFSPNETLSIKFRIWKTIGDFSENELISIESPITTHTISTPPPTPTDLSLIENHSLPNHLIFFSDQVVSDFQIRLGDGICFLVHKAVLSARSTFFNDLLSSDLNQISKDLEGFDPPTFILLLNCLYSGAANITKWENAVKLYNMAQEFQVQFLQRECRSYFQGHITLNNICDLLVLVGKYEDNELDSLVLDLCRSSESLEQLYKSSIWSNLPLPEKVLAMRSISRIVVKHGRDAMQTKREFTNNKQNST